MPGYKRLHPCSQFLIVRKEMKEISECTFFFLSTCQHSTWVLRQNFINGTNEEEEWRIFPLPLCYSSPIKSKTSKIIGFRQSLWRNWLVDYSSACLKIVSILIWSIYLCVCLRETEIVCGTFSSFVFHINAFHLCF